MLNSDFVVLDPKVAGTNITGLTANATTDPLNVGHYNELMLFLNVTAQTGTTPTLDCKLQYSPDGITWVDSGDSFTQITTTTGLFFKKAASIFGVYIRLVFTLGGTSPNYTVAPKIVAKQI